MNFSIEEYKSRLKKVQSSMQDKGIEILISQDPSNMNYLTGYDAWSFYYAQCVIVHANAEEPICFLRDQDAGGAYIKTYLKDENIEPKRNRRVIGIGSQILRSIGLNKIKVLGTPTKYSGLSGFNIEIEGFIDE